MKSFSVFEGKNKFSQLISDAAKGEPQIVTKNGTPTAVVISYTEYQKLKGKKQSLAQFLLDNPARKYGMEDELDFTRSKDMGRPTIDFNSPEFIGEDEVE
jgi:prevent-host-death family protein